VNSQLDTLIAGRLTGADVLGAYSVSMHLAGLPASKLGSVIGEIVLPAFSRLQSDAAALRHHLTAAIQLLGFATFPVFFGLSAVAPEAVEALLGAAWASAIPALTLVPLAIPLRLMTSIIGTAAAGAGLPSVALVNQLVFLLVMSIGFAVGARWGIVGLSLSWVVVFPWVALFGIRHAIAALGISASAILRAIWRPLASTALMYAAVAATRQACLWLDMTAGARLGILIVIGMLGYAASSYIVNREGFRSALRFMRDVSSPSSRR
jgi:O-antigen/teichoic acid export membrane protein